MSFVICKSVGNLFGFFADHFQNRWFQAFAMPKFPVFIQHDANDCGPTCLRMIAKYYGKFYSLETLREKSFITNSGVSLLGISEAAESISFRTKGVKISFDQLQDSLKVLQADRIRDAVI